MGIKLILDFGDNYSARIALLAHLVAQQGSEAVLAAFPMPKGVLTKNTDESLHEETVEASYIVKK